MSNLDDIMSNLDDMINKANDTKDRLAYDIGMDSKRHESIMLEVGDKYIELVIASQTQEMTEVKMYEFIKATYKETNEIFVASTVYGCCVADETLAKMFALNHALKKM